MISTDAFFSALKIVVAASIFYVWVVRYANIITEFRQYKLPNWLRDLVGVFKLSFAVMLVSSNSELTMIASSGIALLMAAALVTHLRIKNSVAKMLPSFSLMCACIFIFIKSI